MELLKELARHQAWADAEHWKTIRGNPALLQDEEIHKRLNHMINAPTMLMALAAGEHPDPAKMKELKPMDQLEADMAKMNEKLAAAVAAPDLDRKIQLPRGPKGPFEAPVHVLLLQALTHSQHHRAQNAARMRSLGATPPMTDYIAWYAQGRP